MVKTDSKLKREKNLFEQTGTPGAFERFELSHARTLRKKKERRTNANIKTLAKTVSDS